MNTTSKSLLQRLRQPAASDAWSRFVDLYTPLLIYWARRAGLQGPDADDAVQDVLLSLLQRLPGFDYDPNRSFRNWLWTLAHNKFREQFRKKSVRAGQLLGEFTDSRQPDPAVVFTEVEYHTFVLRRALELMREEFQPVTWQACWLHVMEDRPADEVAKMLSVTVNVVYLAKSRVLRRLRQDLEGLLDD